MALATRARELQAAHLSVLRRRSLVPWELFSRWLSEPMIHVWAGSKGAIKVGQAMALCDSANLPLFEPALGFLAPAETG